jgi:hypothetical protein
VTGARRNMFYAAPGWPHCINHIPKPAKRRFSKGTMQQTARRS